MYQVGCNVARSAVWRLAILLAALTLLCVRAASAEVRLPDGEWFEQTDDLQVKVMGGYVTVARTWLKNRWYFNPAWAPLKFTYDALGSDIATIERTGWRYERRGAGVWAFDNKNTIVLTPAGYRWQDRQGNSIDYDAKGRIQSYSDRNGVKVTLATDAVGRITGVFNHLGTQMLWLDYAIAADQVLALNVVGNVDVSVPSTVRDATGRRVEYRYANGNLTGVVDVLGHEWTYAYDGSGRLTSRTDAENHAATVTYGVGARVASVTQADGTVTAYGYDYDSAKREIIVQVRYPGGRLEQMWYRADGALRRHEVAGQLQSEVATEARSLIRTEANGARTKDEFDEWDNLVKRTHPDGSVEIFEREPRFSQLSRYVDPNGNTTVLSYDSQGRLTAVTEAAGKPEVRTTTYQYDAYGNLTTSTRVADAVTLEAIWSYEYDQHGNVARVTDPEGIERHYSHNVLGQVTSFTDGRGQRWDFEYDAAGRSVLETDPLGFTTRYSRDRVGNLASITDKRENTTHLARDPRDRLIKTTDALGNSTTSTYDQDGYLIAAVDEVGNSTRFAYDSLKRLSVFKDGAGNEVRLEYPQQGPTASADPVRVVAPTLESRMQYDARRRLVESVSMLDPNGQSTRLSYDANNNRISVTGPDARATRYEYDSVDRTARAIDALGDAIVFSYDNRDNLIAVTDARGHTWRFEYDRLNRLVAETKPLGQTQRYRYNATSKPIEVVDAKGQRTEYDYDAAGQVLFRKEYAAQASLPSKTVTYRYDAKGNLTGWNDGTYSSTRTHDARDRLVSETIGFGAFSLTYRYEYYANGLRKSFVYPDGNTYAYRYSAAGLLEAVDIPSEGSVSVTEFDWLAPARILLPGGTSCRAQYDGKLRLTGLDVTNAAEIPVFQLSQRWGQAGQLVDRTIDGRHTDYTYDEETRLTREVTEGATIAYQLDSVGNRTDDASRPGQWEYDANNRLVKQGNTDYEYDDNGNLTATVSPQGTRRFAYDTSDRLVRVEDGTGNVLAQYEYDPLGRRLSKRSNGTATYFLYADEGLIGEYDPVGAERVAYGWRPGSGPSTAPLFLKRGQRYFYFQNDHLGTPHAAVDRNGVLAWSARYSSFGYATVSPEAVVENNLRFPGQYFDAETGLHYNLLRYYDPRLGRYTQSDPIGLRAGPNPYLYARADPLRFRDPWGLELEPADRTGQAAPCFNPRLFGMQVHNLFTDYARQQGYQANTTFDAARDKVFDRYRPDAWSDGLNGRPIEVWELKPASYEKMPKYQKAIDQLNRYLCTVPPARQPAFPGDPRALVPPGGKLGIVRDCGVDYEVKLHADNGPTGLIFYTYERIDTKNLLDEILDILKQIGRHGPFGPWPTRPPRDDVILN